MTYIRREARDHDERNYIGDARSLVKDLDKGQKYEMYEIVCGKLRSHSHGEKRTKEFEAIKKVLESDTSLEKTRLKKCREGRSAMAEESTPRDGQTTVNRKKV